MVYLVVTNILLVYLAKEPMLSSIDSPSNYAQVIDLWW